ncbi:imidazoleglycerol-phosphate dehydratase HisB [Caniella muris]|uniref:imidazoleglycerol-phosphate dehydratase HisB n=1 Tax=Caniella muris TaxID=2941502 RepID=UPI00203B790E|nr:imidazoleglycerol-phosphate dehydratase HisB [Caniella muris]
MRRATVTRTTGETDIAVTLDLDGTGVVDVRTGVGFFDHMLDAFGRHGLFDLTVRCVGDLDVDAHHTVEDTGIVIGACLREALGGKAGVARFSQCVVPMDEALVLACVDLSGRGELFWDVPVPVPSIGTFDSQLAHEFFAGLARDAGATLHMRELAGENGHHIVEAAFKAAGRALRFACEPDPRVTGVPSTKGTL